MPRIARWWLAIQEYDVDIKCRTGAQMQHADALSRNPVRVVHVRQTDWFHMVQLQDGEVQGIVRSLQENATAADIRDNLIYKDERIYRRTTTGDRLYVPKMAKFSMMRRHHDDIGHPGVRRCLKLMSETFWFPRMRQFVTKYVQACIQCAYSKGTYGKTCGKLHPIERKMVPMGTILIDHLGPFMRSVGGHSYLLTVVDGFTKIV